MALKLYSGAPFGFQSHRFDLTGIHPKRKGPGKCIGLKTLDNNIGPGYYIEEDKNSSFSRSKIDLECKKPGWKRSYAVEQFSMMPYVLNRDMYLSRQEQKRKLGPGYYTIEYSSLKTNKHVQGVMSAKEVRFAEKYKNVIPGPGVYGKSGIPHLYKEEMDQLRKSPSTLGILKNGGNGERSLPITGCNLSPNTYSIPSSIDKIIKHQNGTRGPYDVFSLDRGKPIMTGHWAIDQSHELAPGHYNSNMATNILNDAHHKHHGRFLQMKQYPSKPHDRAYWDNPARMPPDLNNQIAPGTYELKSPNSTIVRLNPPPFNSSSNRNDKQSTMFFSQNFNQVGPGRYDVQRIQDSKYVDSHENAFKSKSAAQLSRSKSLLLGERLKAKNIPTHQKMLTDHHSTEASPCANTNHLHSISQMPLKIV